MHTFKLTKIVVMAALRSAAMQEAAVLFNILAAGCNFLKLAFLSPQ